jgi:hypothetical protein
MLRVFLTSAGQSVSIFITASSSLIGKSMERFLCVRVLRPSLLPAVPNHSLSSAGTELAAACRATLWLHLFRVESFLRFLDLRWLANNARPWSASVRRVNLQISGLYWSS